MSYQRNLLLTKSKHEHKLPKFIYESKVH